MTNTMNEEACGHWVGGFTCGALTGALLGASAALLTAPRSGRSSRRRIQRELDQGVGHLRDKGEELRERGEELFETGKKVARGVAAMRN